MARKVSRKYLTFGVLVLLGAALTYAFWPRPTAVDIGSVERGAMVVTIDEEGRTRVRDAYVVSTPVAGRLLRVDVEPGDPVEAGKSVVALMLPTNPSALDVRSQAQLRAETTAAEAALRLARADRNRAAADQEFAVIELTRTRRLRESNLESQAALDRAIQKALSTEAALQSAEAAIAQRQAELANVRARSISFSGPNAAGVKSGEAIDLYAPSSGLVLRLMQESETTLAAGAPILEIGNVDQDLEVLVELLSADAVQIAPGDRVILSGWGGKTLLNGVVERIEPWGFTKISALGVEEQRVNTILRFTDPPETWKKLGHGFRIEARIVVWEDEKALIVPSSALFRNGENWAVFAVAIDVATLRPVEIGWNNGVEAQVLGGLEAGQRVVLYPSSALYDGIRVTQREIAK